MTYGAGTSTNPDKNTRIVMAREKWVLVVINPKKVMPKIALVDRVVSQRARPGPAKRSSAQIPALRTKAVAWLAKGSD
jgi:hypothetical protein